MRPLNIVKYLHHWEKKRDDLDDALNELRGGQNTGALRDKVDLYDRIRDTIAELTGTLADMNSLTVDIHAQEGFQTLIEAVVEKLAE